MAELVLHPLHLKKLAKQWLLEDTPNFDFAGGVVGDKVCTFVIIFKTPGATLAGIPFSNAVFALLELQPEWFYKDGEDIPRTSVVCEVTGLAQKLLLAERVVLNILCRASGVATTAVEFVQKLQNYGWKGRMAGTRKTTPGFRMVEKYALLVGGVDAHRYDLSSMVMLKDNHTAIYGSIAQAVKEVRKLCGFTQKIEVECESQSEALEAAASGCDIIMLDNFNPSDLNSCAERVKSKFPNVLIEASGGINLENVLDYAGLHIDIISSSSLVQGYKTVDISMKVDNAVYE